MSQELQIKLREFFIVPRKTFAIVGIDPLAENNSVFIKHPISFYGHYILSFIFSIISIDYSLKNYDKMNDFNSPIALLNQLIIILWKILIFMGKRQRIRKLIKRIWEWNERAKPDEFQIVANMSSKNALICKLYYTIVAATGTFGLLCPFFLKLLKQLNGIQSDLEVPHKASFFWDTSTPLGYTAVYVFSTITVSFIINASLAIDSLFLWFVTNILSRFSILKHRFRKAALQNQQTEYDAFIKENIKFHSNMLDLAQELDSIFGEIIFVKSLVSCTQICFLAFRFTEKEISIVSLLYPVIFLAAVAMQLFLYCYSGELIKDQSLMVSTNIYETTNWSQLPVKYQKILQLIMLRSQKCSNITGVFFNLNLSLYLWFFKTAGSLIAVLKTLND